MDPSLRNLPDCIPHLILFFIATVTLNPSTSGASSFMRPPSSLRLGKSIIFFLAMMCILASLSFVIQLTFRLIVLISFCRFGLLLKAGFAVDIYDVARHST